MKRMPMSLYGKAGYGCIGMDAGHCMSKLGLFTLIPSEAMEWEEVLPLYYTRQPVEQAFDSGKNNADLLPLRVQSEETFRGHLMLAFLAAVLLQKLQRDIITKRKKKDKTNPERALMALRNQKCKVYEEELIPQKAVKNINDPYNLFQIECPITIPRKM